MDRVSCCFFCEQEKSAGVQEGDVFEGFPCGIVRRRAVDPVQQSVIIGCSDASLRPFVEIFNNYERELKSKSTRFSSGRCVMRYALSSFLANSGRLWASTWART
jgi:hypothetical protein